MSGSGIVKSRVGPAALAPPVPPVPPLPPPPPTPGRSSTDPVHPPSPLARLERATSAPAASQALEEASVRSTTDSKFRANGLACKRKCLPRRERQRGRGRDRRVAVIACAADMPSIVPPPLKLLIVEDEPSLRQMMEILFRREGYTVVTAPGYRAACEAINGQPQPFPVVLTDLAMPDGSGLDLVSVAKARSAATEVVLLTAH